MPPENAGSPFCLFPFPLPPTFFQHPAKGEWIGTIALEAFTRAARAALADEAGANRVFRREERRAGTERMAGRHDEMRDASREQWSLPKPSDIVADIGQERFHRDTSSGRAAQRTRCCSLPWCHPNARPPSPIGATARQPSHSLPERSAFAAAPLRRDRLRLACRAVAHASVLARVSEGWWAARGSNPGHPD